MCALCVLCVCVCVLCVCLSVLKSNFIQASKRGYTYPRYAWIVFDWYPQKWWTQEVTNNKVNCTDEELERFMERVLSLREDPEPDFSGKATDAGIVSVVYM